MAVTTENLILLETKRWGRLEIEEDEIISFKSGIPGFEHLQKYAIFDSDEMAPFKWMISMDDPDVSFVIITPQLLCPDFQPKLFVTDLADLDVDSDDELILFAIITLTPNPLDSTANLQGPLLINKNKKTGKQIVVTDDQYILKYPILNSGINDLERMN